MNENLLKLAIDFRDKVKAIKDAEVLISTCVIVITDDNLIELRFNNYNRVSVYLRMLDDDCVRYTYVEEDGYYDMTVMSFIARNWTSLCKQHNLLPLPEQANDK